MTVTKGSSAAETVVFAATEARQAEFYGTYKDIAKANKKGDLVISATGVVFNAAAEVAWSAITWDRLYYCFKITIDGKVTMFNKDVREIDVWTGGDDGVEIGTFKFKSEKEFKCPPKARGCSRGKVIFSGEIEGTMYDIR